MEKRRERLLGLVTIALSITICLLIAEVALRFLPVASGMRTVEVTAQSPVFHFTPNRDFVFSRDWDMVLANRGRVNNAGFVNDQDYQRIDKPPLLAVVGDSMIEAAMVPYRETLQGRLANALAGKPASVQFCGRRRAAEPISDLGPPRGSRVWGAGAAHQRSQQRFRSKPFRLRDHVGLLSLCSRCRRGAPASPVRVPPGIVAQRGIDERARPISGFQHAARPPLARAQIIDLRRTCYGGGPAKPGASPWTPAKSVCATRSQWSMLSSETCPSIRACPLPASCSPSKDFAMPMLAAASAGGYFDRVRRALLEKAASLGYETIDLDPFFFEHHRRTGERVEFPRDGHWNGAYHGVAFNAVMASRFIARLIAARDHAAVRSGAGGPRLLQRPTLLDRSNVPLPRVEPLDKL